MSLKKIDKLVSILQTLHYVYMQHMVYKYILIVPFLPYPGNSRTFAFLSWHNSCTVCLHPLCANKKLYWSQFRIRKVDMQTGEETNCTCLIKDWIISGISPSYGFWTAAYKHLIRASICTLIPFPAFNCRQAFLLVKTLLQDQLLGFC